MATPSRGYRSTPRSRFSPRHDHRAWHLEAVLNEVSSLRLGESPTFQGSCITTILEHPKKPAAVSTSDRAAVGGPVMTGRIRRTFETPITVR